MEYRPAVLSDLNRIMEIAADAQSFMRSCGVDQWQDGYPTREIFEEDIQKGRCHVISLSGAVAGVMTLQCAPEECYGHLKDGKWLTEGENYAVIHRMAVGGAFHGMGLANAMFSFAEELGTERACKSVRADTHRDNKAMRSLLEKRGFIYCGTVFLDRRYGERNERVCYEKLL